MKWVPGDLIDDSRIGFITGRSILDGVVLAKRSAPLLLQGYLRVSSQVGL